MTGTPEVIPDLNDGRRVARPDACAPVTTDMIIPWGDVRPGDQALSDSDLITVSEIDVRAQDGHPGFLIAYAGGTHADGRRAAVSPPANWLTAVRRPVPVSTSTGLEAPANALHDAYWLVLAGDEFTWEGEEAEVREGWLAVARCAEDAATLATEVITRVLTGELERLLAKNRKLEVETVSLREQLATLRAEAETAASSLITEAANQRKQRLPLLGTRLDGIARRLVSAASAT